MKQNNLWIILLLCFMNTLMGQKINSVEFSSGFSIPVDIAFDHVDNMYVVGKRGIISIVQSDGTKINEPFLDIEDRVNSSANERGLLGLSFHPDYENNGFFFVNYTGSDGRSFISRFTRNSATTADPDSEEVILSIPQPFNNHNAGSLHFGPDGYLYVPFGDGGSGGDPGNRSQNPNTLLGKMLRIDVDNGLPYQIPPTNPFINSQDTLAEIWAFGFRNPWKFSFDMVSGDMYIADVGQNKWEEVSVEKANSKGGLNYGWRCYEGFEAFNTGGCADESEYTPPVFVYLNDENKAGCSITGGYVYRGSDPYLFGKYIYGDFCTGKIWALYQDDCDSWFNEELMQISAQELSTFGQDNYGALYYAELGSGKVFKISAGCKLSAQVFVNNVTCNSNGSIEIIPSESNATIDISGGSFTDLKPGKYDITVTNNEGCINYLCVIVEDEGDFDFPDIAGPEIAKVCAGETLLVDFSNLTDGFPGLQVNLYKDSVLLIEEWDGILTIEDSASFQVEFYDTLCSSGIVDFIISDVVPVPDLEISVLDNDLIANSGFESYRWFEGTEEIQGVTGNVFNEYKTGVTYTVIGTTNDGCVKVSDPFIISNTQDIDWLSSLLINPNPSSGLVRITATFKSKNKVMISIHDASGRILERISIEHPENLDTQIDMSKYPSGTYSVSFRSGNKVFNRQIIKK